MIAGSDSLFIMNKFLVSVIFVNANASCDIMFNETLLYKTPAIYLNSNLLFFCQVGLLCLDLLGH
jgi:hypothetical protein